MKLFRFAMTALLAVALASCEESGGEKTTGPIEITSITLNETAKSLAPGDVFQLEVTDVLPANATDKSVHWVCPDHTMVSVSSTGKVSVSYDAVDGTRVTITAIPNDGSGKTATCVITVAHIKVTSITFTPVTPPHEWIEPGGFYHFGLIEVLPADATDNSVTWSSSDSAVATVEENGTVTIASTAADGATATITAKANDGSGVKVDYPVTVAYHRVTEVTLNHTEVAIALGGSMQLSADRIPSNATVENVLWSSSNPAVATVDQNGLVSLAPTATDGATATITATARDKGGKSAGCRVKAVFVPADGVLINDLVWAKCNVGVPGSFAASPESFGRLYQWNRRTGWPSTGPWTGMNDTPPSGSTWSAANDPCPAGWRVPSREDWDHFIYEKVTQEWVTLNGVNGRKFTDKFTGASIFLPAAGYRIPYDESIPPQSPSTGYYWLSDPDEDEDESWIGYAWYVRFDGFGLTSTTRQGQVAQSVRCVRQ